MIQEQGKNYAVVKVYFATDRKKNLEGSKISFGSRRGDLSYGTCEVSIPRDHRMGELEAPSIYRFELREDPHKHVVLMETTPLEYGRYISEVKAEVSKSTKKSAFIFVHGYNVTFKDAARRTAQMKYDLGFDGASIFFSWPSKGKTAGYPADEAVVELAQLDFKAFLAKITTDTDAENIYMIAHSMGNRAMARALVSLVSENPALKKRFREVILAAPDIDADVFSRDIAPSLASSCTRATMYASSKDRALKASKTFHGYRRAGDTNPSPLLVTGIETIDATNVDTSLLGHSYWADNRSIISDIYYLFNNGFGAQNRSGLRPITTPNGTFWRFAM